MRKFSENKNGDGALGPVLVDESELGLAFGGEGVVFAGGVGGGFDEAGGDEALDPESGKKR